ncbi:hypothetical protein EPA93_00470 [Ktedonosporobacter rubrisoli]|uniref:Uncharacterized protein n=1 Tax=Ktedonosporobacter rubrisoli TaxID=2509675 RepID=A0A4P6JHP4_KTERU|nr:hypothetical protein [Ktedonosporobacter rubrisoli]QBD74545.1 hypothetical protein EPA93_00470 [Ktedonosporobacter rubrisoli]
MQHVLSTSEGKQAATNEVRGKRKATQQLIEMYQQFAQRGNPLVAAIALTCSEDLAQEIDIVANPEKLQHISLPIMNK